MAQQPLTLLAVAPACPILPQACPDHPLLLRLKPELVYQHLTDGGNPRCVPINRTGHFEFETRLFKGRAMLWVTGLQTSPPGLFKVRGMDMTYRHGHCTDTNRTGAICVAQ